MIEVGQLHITLNCSAGQVQSVNIQSTRPLHISRLFIGKTPEQTLTTLPLLFNVCGVAQAFAAFTALSQDENLAATLARQMLLNVEIVREHCWWLLINRDKAQLAPFIKFVNAFKHALFVNGNAFSLNSQLQINNEQLTILIKQLENTLDELFTGQRVSCLALRNDDDLRLWLKDNTSIPALLLREVITNQHQSLGRSALNLLPLLNAADLRQNLSLHNADDFSRNPSWQGKRYETSCLNRQQQQPLIAYLLTHYGNGLLTRLASRLIELANMPNRLREGSCDLSHDHGVGLGTLQASRGLLIHSVALKNGIISHYHIIAPTEWNFSPDGIAALSLQQLSATNKTTLQQQAALLINAIDPCVGFELTINWE